MDTTMFMSNIKKAGRLALAFDVLVKAIKAIPEAQLPESLAKYWNQDLKQKYCLRQSQMKMKANWLNCFLLGRIP